MRNQIKIKNIEISAHTILCEYEISGEWEKYFKTTKTSFTYNIDLTGLPKSVAVIPFIANVLPVSWVLDADIVLDEIDEDFADSIPAFKQGYIDMYPTMEFQGTLSARKVKNNQRVTKGKAVTLFSGGVDAFSTLLTHIEEAPGLVVIWGSDVAIEDEVGWSRVRKHIESTAEQFQLPFYQIKSEFRLFFKEGWLTEYVKKSGDNWWHGFQHGLGLIGHAAPIAYISGIEKLYIASSFNVSLKGQYTCASDPTIDNHVRYCGCRTIHDGYEYKRQDKVRNICSYAGKNQKQIPLRVCWESDGGGNCCTCEKCYRTMLEIASEAANPRNFGFEWNKKVIRKCRRDMKYRLRMPASRIQNYYVPIRESLMKNREKIAEYKQLDWIVSLDWEHFNTLLGKRIFGKVNSLRKRLKR